MGAPGVGTGTDDSNLAVQANMDLIETELLVGQPMAIAVQPCRPIKDKSKWAD
jgi:hypothetical protein